MYISKEILILILTGSFGYAIKLLVAWQIANNKKFDTALKTLENKFEKAIDTERELQNKEVGWLQKVFDEKINSNHERAKLLQSNIDKVSDKATDIGHTLHNKIDEGNKDSGKRLGDVEEKVNKLEASS